MNFVTFAALFATAQAGTESPNTATGALNFLWNDYFNCPDFTSADNLVEYMIRGEQNVTFEGYKQLCAEAAYGLSAEYAPCIMAMYVPGGVLSAADPTEPYYACGAMKGEYLVDMDGFKQSADWDNMEVAEGVNMEDENNRHAACINTSPQGIQGAYSCSRGPLMAGAGYLTLGAAAALSVAAMI